MSALLRPSQLLIARSNHIVPLAIRSFATSARRPGKPKKDRTLAPMAVKSEARHPGRPKTDRTLAPMDVNCEQINKKQLSSSASNWTLKHAGNIGINWPTQLDFPEKHPAEYFGKVYSVADILADKTTTMEMKMFLKPILSKEGPSGTQIDYRKLGRPVPQSSSIFNNVISHLKAICCFPSIEVHTKNLLIELCSAVGLNDAGHGLAARVENTIVAEFLGGVRTSAKLEVIVGKLRDSVYELPDFDVKSDLINFIASQAKKPKVDSRDRGESQILAELTCAMLANYAFTGRASPIVSMFANGPYIKFVSMEASKTYIEAVISGTLAGIKVDDRPHFAVYPAYKQGGVPEINQGFNLLDPSEREQAVITLIQLRHNLICSCPLAEATKKAN